MIDTRFWSDNFISDLNPLDRYLFLYFLTNEHTNISGIYEVPLKRIADETGIEKEMLLKMMKRLSGRIDYVDGWVAIKNFAKYQSDNASVRKGVENAKSLVPKHILQAVDTLGQGGDTLGGASDILELKLELESEPKLELNTSAPRGKKTPKFHPLSGEVLKAFEKVDPKVKTMYANTTQRKAAGFLIDEYGLDRVLRAIALLPAINQQNLYIAQITTPYELQQNWVKLGNAYKKRTNAQQENLAKVIW